MKDNHGLSIQYYIKNNKQRLFTLIISLTVFMIMLYSMAFFLEPSRQVMMKTLLLQTEKIQLVHDMSNFGKGEALGRDLLSVQAVDYVFPCNPVKTNVDTIVENLPLGVIYLVEKENIQAFLNYTSADITDGRLPQKNNEVVVDELYAKNQKLTIGDDIENQLSIVGMLKSDCYLIVGASDYTERSNCVAILSSGKDVNFRRVLEDIGYDTDDFIVEDNISKRDVLQRYADTENGIYFLVKTISVIVVIICLVVLFSLYIYDRQPELCFYYSIGFSKKDIYLSILRILLFVFFLSLLLGFTISFAVFFLIKYLIIMPIGITAIFVMPRETLRCLSCLFLIFASLQPSIFFAMQKINTIDSLEEEQI